MASIEEILKKRVENALKTKDDFRVLSVENKLRTYNVINFNSKSKSIYTVNLQPKMCQCMD